MRVPNPLRPLSTRLESVLWSWRGDRRLRRGDARGAVRAYQAALRRRPGRYVALMRLAGAHLYARELHEARRYLAQAREADPRRYEREAAGFLARRGFDLEAICRLTPPARQAEPVVHAAVRATREVTSDNLPFGDCRDLDEYARFRAMPPISRAEADEIDWDRVIEDLLDE